MSLNSANLALKLKFMARYNLSDEQFHRIVHFGAVRGLGIVNVGTVFRPVLLLEEEGLEQAYAWRLFGHLLMPGPIEVTWEIVDA